MLHFLKKYLWYCYDIINDMVDIFISKWFFFTGFAFSWCSFVSLVWPELNQTLGNQWFISFDTEVAIFFCLFFYFPFLSFALSFLSLLDMLIIPEKIVDLQKE